VRSMRSRSWSAGAAMLMSSWWLEMSPARDTPVRGG
jgi:hypothetical protein